MHLSFFPSFFTDSFISYFEKQNKTTEWTIPNDPRMTNKKYFQNSKDGK